MEEEKKIYLKAYKEGFESALKMSLAYVLDAKNELYADYSNAKDVLDELENKLKY